MESFRFLFQVDLSVWEAHSTQRLLKFECSMSVDCKMGPSSWASSLKVEFMTDGGFENGSHISVSGVLQDACGHCHR